MTWPSAAVLLLLLLNMLRWADPVLTHDGPMLTMR